MKLTQPLAAKLPLALARVTETGAGTSRPGLSAGNHRRHKGSNTNRAQLKMISSACRRSREELELLLDSEEAAAMLKTHPQTLQKLAPVALIQREEFPHVKTNKHCCKTIPGS